jgi:hypothetical protein
MTTIENKPWAIALAVTRTYCSGRNLSYDEYCTELKKYYMEAAARYEDPDTVLQLEDAYDNVNSQFLYTEYVGGEVDGHNEGRTGGNGRSQSKGPWVLGD